VATNRRNFLREMMGQVARGAGELVGQALPLDAIAPDEPPEPAAEMWPVPAPSRCASLDEAAALADEVGLGSHQDTVLAACRWSLRLSPSDDAHAPPRVSDSSSVVEIDLTWVAALGESGLLPDGGVLRLYPISAPEWAPAPETLAGSPALAGDHQLEVAPELVLPRAWSEAVGRLALDTDELEAWEALRYQLAELQSTVTFDAASEPTALHRLLGYPEERRGDMPLVCEMLANGVELGDEPAAAHSRAREFEAGAARWLLLAQLSADARLGWSWGADDARLYLWIHEADLSTRRFENVRVFRQ
jgi:hypothetical protein